MQSQIVRRSCSSEATALFSRVRTASRGTLQGLCATSLLLAVSATGSAQQPAATPPAPPPQPTAVTPAVLPQITPSQANPAPAGAGAASVGAADAPATPPATASVAGVDAEHYIIGPEDSLQITVWKEPTLTGTVPVRPDGMISMALLNDVPAAGMTPMQLSADITTKLKRYINDPIVSVLVSGVNSRKVFLIGEVNKVGPLSLASEMTPLQAISSAGGLTTFAHPKKIYILRGAKGHQQKIPFNYKDALKGDSRQDIPLQSGDTIVVP